MQRSLVDTVPVKVRFNEVDSLGIVWHGHYVRYFEDGRESFGEKYQLRYLDFYNNGYVVPIVSIQAEYKRVLKYGDNLIVETIYIYNESAKIKFNYRLLNEETGELVVTGSTTQVFLKRDDMSLQLINPDFYQDWKLKKRIDWLIVQV